MCVCVCVVVYVCMLRVRCNTVCWRRAPRIGQACLHPQSALFANINPVPLVGHAQASKPNQATHLVSQARWSPSRCSFPDRTGRLPSRRSQRPRPRRFAKSIVCRAHGGWRATLHKIKTKLDLTVFKFSEQWTMEEKNELPHFSDTTGP